MNANGSLFHLLLGEADWGACSVAAGDGVRALGEVWDDPLSLEERSFVPEWRGELAAIAIARLPQDLPPTPGEVRFDLSHRRGAAADRHGNIYAVSDDMTGMTVQAAGTRTVSPFWPDPRSEPAPCESAFVDCERHEETRRIIDLIALQGDYLLALHDTSELLRFDLVSGGDPDRIVISQPEGFSITALAPASDGGAFLLDGAAKRLFRVTDRLILCTEEMAEPSPTLFQPDDGPEQTARTAGDPWFADLSAIDEPLGLFQLDANHVVILDHRDGGIAALFLVTLDTKAVAPLLEMSFNALGMVVLPPSDKPEDTTRTALFWGETGNQAYAVQFEPDGTSWAAGEDPELRPLRRFGGRNLVVAGPFAHYDSGEPMRWVGIGVKHRCRFAESSTFATPVYDSDVFQCVWDRIRFDGRIPAGCEVRIEARSYDDKTQFDIDPEAGWQVQPVPYPNGDRAELPALALPRQAGEEDEVKKCWDVLLQNVQGRYAQLRVTLVGDGRQSPAISALRLWYPRYSYARNFLPQVYSQDPVAGDFTDRFLASNEGVNTALEDRIAAAHLLIDPRTVPAEALDWLADWFDVALDPAWDERRRRLFITHAAKFFGWRGTLPGLQLALSLAFDECIDEEGFALPSPPATGHSGIRILEHFRTRKAAREFPPAPSASSGIHALLDREGLWHPSEARSGLIERWAWARGQEAAAPEERSAPFSLVAADYDEPSEWAGFMQNQIGLAPSIGAEERARWEAYCTSQGLEPHPIPSSGSEGNGTAWQGFVAIADPRRALWRDLLIERYATIAELNLTWASDWLSFDDIPLPHRAPSREAPIRDWLDFEGALAPIHGSAHRFSVLIPRQSTAFDPDAEAQATKLAERIIRLEKPAHTVFDVRLFWAMNRVGEARIGRDTEIGEGSRAQQLVPPSILGRSVIGASFVGGDQTAPAGRELIAC